MKTAGNTVSEIVPRTEKMAYNSSHTDATTVLECEDEQPSVASGRILSSFFRSKSEQGLRG